VTRPKHDPKPLIIFAGLLELMRPLGQFSKAEQDRLATTLREIASSIEKGALAAPTARFIVEFEADPRPAP
jgi:hypothetical protein